MLIMNLFWLLTKHDNNYLTELHQLFMEKVIRPQMRPKGFEAIKKHQDLGHTIVGITATSDFITAPIFREFGITEILATNAEVVDGKYTGKVAGLACYQKVSLRVLTIGWLDAVCLSLGLIQIQSMTVLLEYATHAIAVNPDDRLEKLAQEHNWEIQDWSI